MNTKIFHLLTLGGLLFSSALAQDLPDKPILRVEGGMHSAKISRIDVDAAERFLVTGSIDKTARVWDLATGRQLEVLRPPIGAGNDGMVYAVAISPDARTVAVGGWLGGVAGAMSIYLFDRQTGNVSGRIAALPGTVHHLAYSPDGRFLVAALGGRNGIRLYRTSDYTQVAEDSNYGGLSPWADFTKVRGSASSIRLITSAQDGFIRLYEVSGDGALRMLTKTTFPWVKSLGAVKFSPDSSRVAVSSTDGGSSSVSVLSATDLSVACSPNTAGVRLGVGPVAWSDDGAFLFAEGFYPPGYAGGQAPMIRWNKGGCGSATELPGAFNAITAIRALKGGRVIFASNQPVVRILDRQGVKSRFFGEPDPSQLIDAAHFFVSHDGLLVCVSRENPARPNCASLADRRDVSRDPENDRSLSPPITTTLPIKDWDFHSNPGIRIPKLNGKPLDVVRLRCLAIAPSQRRFVVGSEFALQMFDDTGTQLWNVRSPAAVAAVNISGDSRVAVALFGDGTIRWFRAEDGAELLAVSYGSFYGSEPQHWVAWTPSGYYDAAPGDEGLIGWHINRGRDAAAEFYPVSRFRSTYYRPDVIARLLTTLDESVAVQQANSEAGRRQQQPESITQLLPPQISIVSPADGAEVSSTEVTIRYSLHSPNNEPVTAVRAMVDGRPVDVARRIVPITSGYQALEVRVSIPQRDCEISVIAENRHSPSEPATIRLRWRGTEPFIIQPKLYILAIGISAYPDPYTLHMAAKDANDFVSVMQPQKGRLYRDIEVKLLTDRTATRDNVLDGLDWIQKSTTQHDVAMVFLSGHGDTEAGNYYFIPVDFDRAKLKRTAVEFSVIKDTVQSIAGKVLFFVDTCYAGGVLGERTKGLGPDINGIVNELTSAENGAVVFTASTGNQSAIERDEWGNGAFTKALVAGLRGEADYGKTGKITVNMLDLYISETVKQLTDGRQTPTTAKPQTIADFPVAIR